MIKRRKNKLIKNYVIIAIIILLLYIIIMFFSLRKKDTINYNDSKSKNYDEVIEDVKNEFMDEGEIVPNNYNFLTRIYDGEVEDTNIYTRIHTLVINYIPKIYELKDQSDLNIEEYYEQNKDNINNVLGTIELEDYKKFFEKIRELPDVKYVDSSFILAGYNAGEEYDKIDLEVQFEESKLTLTMELINEKISEKPNIKFRIK